MAADLTDPEDLQRISQALALGEGSGREAAVVTCFEVIEHLASFVALLGWASALAQEHGVTFLISVPNDAFWSIQNPHHRTSWSEGAFEELRSLLPGEHTLLRQVALAGSALVGWEALPERARAGGRDRRRRHGRDAFHRRLRPPPRRAAPAAPWRSRRT